MKRLTDPMDKQYYSDMELRLLEVENILGDEYDLDRLRERVQADREGRCVVQRFSPGQTIWVVERDEDGEAYDFSGYVFVTSVNGIALVCPTINDSSDIDVILSYQIENTMEPLNNSLCSVPTRCISRHLRLAKVISAQNSHYLSAFLLRFPKKGRLSLCQVVESFRPAMASAYKLAQANIAYSRFSFFFRPRYTVFL